jgi:retron-type reverse transcriptase
VEHCDKGGQVDAVCLDFSKAFDVVPHNLLLKKFSAMNLDPKVVHWIDMFLSNRTQAVQVGSVLSRKISVTSGVPQGTVLGPALFIGFINDIAKSTDCQIRLFADDCIVYQAIETPAAESTSKQPLITSQSGLVIME